MSRDGVRHSPVPDLISDAELNEYPHGMGLRIRGVDQAGSQLVSVWYVNPSTGTKTTLGGSASTRKDVIKNLQRGAQVLLAKQGQMQHRTSSVTFDERAPLGHVARLWWVDAEQHGYWTPRRRRRPYKATTLRNKRDFYRAHLAGKKSVDGTVLSKPHSLLDTAVGSITTEMLCAVFENEWQQLGETTKAKLHTLLTQFFDFAKRNGAVATNPMLEVPGYDGQGQRHDDKYLSLDEIRHFLAAIPVTDGTWVEAKVRHASHYGLHVKAFLLTGLRINEMLSLRWADVVFDSESCSSYFVIRQQRSGDTTTGLKTAAGTRNVYLVDDLAADLRRHCERVREQEERECGKPLPHPNPDGLIFTSPRGLPLSEHQFRRVLAKMGVAAGMVDHVHPHYLRHTSSTYWADAVEGNEKVFNAILGWKDRHVSGRYVSVPQSRLIKATRKFQRDVVKKVLPPEHPADV